MDVEYEKYSPQRIAKDLETEIRPLIDWVIVNKEKLRDSQLKKDYVLFKETYQKETKKKDFLIDSIAKEWDDPEMYEEGGHFVIAYMFAYLGLIETVAKCAVDMVTMLLVANGKEFKVESHRKWKIVNSWEGINKSRVSLYEELYFLQENGISSFMRLLDSRLRNDIAHINFRVSPEESSDEWIYLPLRDKNGHQYGEVLASKIVRKSIRSLLECLDITENLLFELDCLIEE